jgi:hypothetical protein
MKNRAKTQTQQSFGRSVAKVETKVSADKTRQNTNYSQSVTELVNWLADESIGGGCDLELVYELFYGFTVSKALNYGIVELLDSDIRLVPLAKGGVYVFNCYITHQGSATWWLRRLSVDVLHPELDNDAAYLSMRYLGYYENTYTLVSLSCPLPGKVCLE